MAKTKNLTTEMRLRIVNLHQSGKSNREISKILRIPRQTVDYNVIKFKKFGCISNRKGKKKARITTASDDNYLAQLSIRNRRLTAPELAAFVQKSLKKKISVTTVKRRLHEKGLYGRIAVKKPLLREVNRRKRLIWAKEHSLWTVDDWKKVLWSDESKFMIFGTKRNVYVRRKVNESHLKSCIVPTVKHDGGSVMVWGCFGNNRVGDIVKIDGIMKKEDYRKMLYLQDAE